MIRKLLKILSWRRDLNPRPTDYKWVRQHVLPRRKVAALTVIGLILSRVSAPIRTLPRIKQVEYITAAIAAAFTIWYLCFHVDYPKAAFWGHGNVQAVGE